MADKNTIHALKDLVGKHADENLKLRDENKLLCKRNIRLREYVAELKLKLKDKNNG